MKKDNLGIYIHIPFCQKKCDYCDFLSFSNEKEKVDTYIEALKREIVQNRTKGENRLIDTIYIGGGTPSYINAQKIEEIIQTLKENFHIASVYEMTIEINPGTINKEKLEKYKKCGINRLSIGLQSTNNEVLRKVGRIHTYEQFLETYDLARKLKFTNINIDLMLGLPSQTEEILQGSLKEIIALKPEHISMYSLIVEEGTYLFKKVEEKQITLPEEEMERTMYWMVKNMLEDNGFIHYEISNFARQQYESKHNLHCWEQKEYLGFGLGAHSYYEEVRYSNPESFEHYLSNDRKYIIHEKQNKEMKEKEYMMLGLRKLEGVKISAFKMKFVDNPLYIFQKELNKLVQEELIEIESDQIKLTNKGLDYANLVWEEFV